ncbi:MAG: helix-turn-helix transcriptional regulator [Bacteroidetes bacterium]|nr:helix-turn-helix transcriptional regulator [Bacteroidota bacterium]
MKAETVRSKARRFIEKGEMSQNELARKCSVAPSTFSGFMKGQYEMSQLQLKEIMRVIEPLSFNPRVVGAKHRTMFLARGFDQDEIAIIASEIRGGGNVSG